MSSETIVTNETAVEAQRNFKDTVFRALFNDKKALLSLYNALNGSDYDNEEELEKRLSRDKVAFDKVEESVNETMRQQKEYEKLFKELSGALNIHIVDTDGKSIDEVYDEVIKIKGYQV